MPLPVPRAAFGTIGIPDVPAGPLGATSGAALMPALLELGTAEPIWPNAGATEVQPWGTESMPTEAARPTPAVTSTLLILGPAQKPVPGPKPLPTASPGVGKWSPKAPTVGPMDCKSGLAEPPAAMPNVDIPAAEPVPDARLAPDVNAVGNEARVAKDPGDVDDADATEVTPCTRLGAVAVVTWVVSAVGISDVIWVDSKELSCVDIIELIWDSMGLSGVDIKEVSWLDSRELSPDAV